MPNEDKSAFGEGTLPELGKRVEERFGILPNFFCLSPETPEITEKLWGFAQAAYLDNPLPALFKERLFVHLSRFCSVRYCIARHVGFLIGLGRPAGDASVSPQTVADVVKLLRRPFPRGEDLQSRVVLSSTHPPLPAEICTPDSEMEDAIFALAGHVFLQTSDAPACLKALENLFGAGRLQYLLLFLAFVRAAHYWTRVHPDLVFEDDIRQVLTTHEALADSILNDPEASSVDIAQSILDELPALRARADKAVGLLAAIVDSSEDAIVSKNLDGIITSWNGGAQRLFGYTADEVIGQHIAILIPIDRRAEEVNILNRIRRGQRIEHFDTVRVCKDGSFVDISLTISPVRDATGKIVGASKIARNITEQKRIQQALRESEEQYRTLADALDTQVQFRTRELERRNAEVVEQAEQLRSLSNRMLQLQDDERRRIARELHDSAGQSLVALSMSLGQVARAAKNSPDQLAKNIHQAEELVRHLTQEIRTTSYLLHPPMLDESGLSLALRCYIQGLTERGGLEIDLEMDDDFERPSPGIELVISRLVQECLTNIHRHSGSTSALIRLEREQGNIRVSVQDKGKGISREKLAGIDSKGMGVGIRGMRERVRHFDGELLIESTGAGTKVTAIIPVETRSEAEDDSVQHRAKRRISA
jgi:PAS domain S-box-containing protein